MATVYEQAPEEIRDTIAGVLQEYHSHLVQADVSIGVLVCYDDEAKTQPTLMHQGYPAAAVVRIVSQKDRAAGLPDAIITIDLASWERSSDERRVAIADHELHHLDLSMDEFKVNKTDALGRPKLQMRKHDLVVGGFTAIIARHGTVALEYEHIEVALKASDTVLQQRLLPFPALSESEDLDLQQREAAAAR